MKVLLDENLPPRLRLELLPHDVYTVGFQGWKDLKNGALLALAEATEFQVFITVDKSLTHQQNITASSLGFLVLISNLWPIIVPQLTRIRKAIEACNPASIQTIEL